MPRLRARTILLAQAGRLEASSRIPGPAALRIAVGVLRPGAARPGHPGARRPPGQARARLPFVRRLIEAVPDEQLDAAGALLLGEALYELGAFEAADRVLARGPAVAPGEQVALRLAVIRGKNAQWGLCQPEAALAINAAARNSSPRLRLAEELIAEEASRVDVLRAPGPGARP